LVEKEMRVLKGRRTSDGRAMTLSILAVLVMVCGLGLNGSVAAQDEGPPYDDFEEDPETSETVEESGGSSGSFFPFAVWTVGIVGGVIAILIVIIVFLMMQEKQDRKRRTEMYYYDPSIYGHQEWER
jgi:hypothetical protein